METGLKAETVSISHFSSCIQKYKRLADLIAVAVCVCVPMTEEAEKIGGSSWYMGDYV